MEAGEELRRRSGEVPVIYVALTVLYVALTVLCVVWTILYVALTVLYVVLTDIFLPCSLDVMATLWAVEAEARCREP